MLVGFFLARWLWSNVQQLHLPYKINRFRIEKYQEHMTTEFLFHLYGLWWSRRSGFCMHRLHCKNMLHTKCSKNLHCWQRHQNLESNYQPPHLPCAMTGDSDTRMAGQVLILTSYAFWFNWLLLTIQSENCKSDCRCMLTWSIEPAKPGSPGVVCKWYRQKESYKNWTNVKKSIIYIKFKIYCYIIVTICVNLKVRGNHIASVPRVARIVPHYSFIYSTIALYV
jgi:hypothetical protein